MALIIVESPTKARTFNRIVKLAKLDHFVFATFGHIRDLPKNELAIDYEKNFKPKYQIISSKTKVVSSLKKIAQDNNEIILATDLDREGEAIAYHIAYILGFINEHWPDFILKSNEKKLSRIVFHEITPKALIEALKNPLSLRFSLVKAQNARRILDRIVGYEISPLLWKKSGKKWLSAGRVQTVALRLIVEREKEIEAFKKEKYWQIYGFFEQNKTKLKCRLVKKGDKSYDQIIRIKLFDGVYQFSKTIIDQLQAKIITADLKSDRFTIFNLEETIGYRYPPPPFITSTLQQEAFQRFGFSAKMTMKLAQDLYEQGYITYHRTDSFNLATSFVFACRKYIEKNYGKDYLPEKPRGFKTKSKTAQEAHEAIRPTDLKKELKYEKEETKITRNHKRLYQLIYNRALATQMKEATIKTVRILIQSAKGYLFESEVTRVLFPGFFLILNPDYVKDNRQDLEFKKGEKIDLIDLFSEEKETQPPYRYNEASLIRSLEEKGIGRPSTYASIISLIQEKNYVEKENRYFKPTKVGTVICQFLVKNFSQLFDLGFTAAMEDQLDEIAADKVDFITVLNQFYQPFRQILEAVKSNHQLINIEEEISGKVCPQCQSPLVVRYSKFGKFLACQRYPDCKFTQSLFQTVANKKCPKCGAEIVVKFSKSRKRFYGCANWPKCDFVAWSLRKIDKEN